MIGGLDAACLPPWAARHVARLPRVWRFGGAVPRCSLPMVYGANDMGSLMIEENVVAEAGTVHYLTLDQIRHAISELGYEPRQRNVHYELVDQSLESRAVEVNRNRPALAKSDVYQIA